MHGSIHKELFNGINGNAILKTNAVKKKGIYSPLTQQRNFYVVTGNNNMALVHCFAHVKDPLNKQKYFDTAYNFLNWANPENVSTSIQNVDKYMNPNIKLMSTVFGIFIDVEQTKHRKLRGGSSNYNNNNNNRQAQSDEAIIVHSVVSNMLQSTLNEETHL